MVEVTENHFSLQTLDIGLVALGLKEWTLVMLELAMEIALFDAAATATDVAQVAGLTRMQKVDGSLEMELHALLHKGQDGLVTDVAITLEFGEPVTIEYLTISSDGDAAKATVAGDGVWRVAFHEIGVFGIGIDSALNLHDTVVELAVLCFGVIRIATRQDFLAEFEENRMLALAANGGDHLLIALSSIALKILEGEGGGNRRAYASIGNEDDVVDDTVEMASTTHLGVGSLVETIDAHLDLADKRRESVNQIVGPKDTIGEDGGSEPLMVGMLEDVLEIGIHERFATSEGDVFTTL